MRLVLAVVKEGRGYANVNYSLWWGFFFSCGIHYFKIFNFVLHLLFSHFLGSLEFVILSFRPVVYLISIHMRSAYVACPTCTRHAYYLTKRRSEFSSVQIHSLKWEVCFCYIYRYISECQMINYNLNACMSKRVDLSGSKKYRVVIGLKIL